MRSESEVVDALNGYMKLLDSLETRVNVNDPNSITAYITVYSAVSALKWVLGISDFEIKE